MDILDLKDIHKNQECVILTCGPSLKEYSKKKILDFLKGKVVMAVKEAFIEYTNETDYFFLNTSRLRHYPIENTKSKIIFNSHIPWKKEENVYVMVEDKPFSIENQLLRKKNFEEYEIENNQRRPWGPGILYESVFYTCKLMGFKNVYTIGWDLVDVEKDLVINHFFDDSEELKYKGSRRWTEADTKLENHIEEMKMVNLEIVDFYNYFKEKGMNIFVVGEQSYVNRKIPRIEL